MKSRNISSGIIGSSLVLCLGISLLSVVPGHDVFGAQETSVPRYGGTLKVAGQYEGAFVGFPPKLLRTTGQRQAAPAIEPLFRVDKAGKPVPWLATGAKDDVRGRTVTISLRKGVKFHDGTPFDAGAVKWNLAQCAAAKAAGTEKFGSIDMVNDHAIRINLTEWDSTVTSNLAMNLGMMISPTAYKKNGEDWCASHPVGTGPFEFVSWEKDIRTVYRKSPGYWQKGKPYLDRIEWYVVGDQMTLQFTLRKGELHLAQDLAPKDLGGLVKDGMAVFRGKIGSGAMALITDSANPKSPFADLRVRQAAQYAIDTSALAKSVLYGEVEAATQFVSKSHWGYNPDIVGYPYNPAKAKQLLANAGYSNGFKTRIAYLTNATEDQIFTAVQGYLRSVGIDAELDPMQAARFDQFAVKGGKWEGLIRSLYTGNPDIAAFLALRYSGGNYFGQMLVPEDYLKAIQNATTAPDFMTKQKYTRQAMKLAIDKYCLPIVLFIPSDFIASQPYLHGHGMLSTPNTAWWTPEEAWLER